MHCKCIKNIFTVPSPLTGAWGRRVGAGGGGGEGGGGGLFKTSERGESERAGLGWGDSSPLFARSFSCFAITLI
jgi:hypothetical protein